LSADFNQPLITEQYLAVISDDHDHWVIIGSTDLALIIGTADYGVLFTIFLQKKTVLQFWY
jgi:hypothetical protein